jgi:hypothetical protein
MIFYLFPWLLGNGPPHTPILLNTPPLRTRPFSQRLSEGVVSPGQGLQEAADLGVSKPKIDVFLSDNKDTTLNPFSPFNLVYTPPPRARTFSQRSSKGA